MRDGYSYELFRASAALVNGSDCWVAERLRRRPGAVLERLTVCDGQLDAHHLVPKQRIRREFRHGVEFGLEDRLVPATRGTPGTIPVGELLNDGANGVVVCRRHHDLLERRLVVLFRDELPESVEAFAGQVGMLWSLERDFRPRTLDCPGELSEDVRAALRLLATREPDALSDYGRGLSVA